MVASTLQYRIMLLAYTKIYL